MIEEEEFAFETGLTSFCNIEGSTLGDRGLLQLPSLIRDYYS